MIIVRIKDFFSTFLLNKNKIIYNSSFSDYTLLLSHFLYFNILRVIPEVVHFLGQLIFLIGCTF